MIKDEAIARFEIVRMKLEQEIERNKSFTAGLAIGLGLKDESELYKKFPAVGLGTDKLSNINVRIESYIKEISEFKE